jgi:4-amino-4-deoxy-L-arabinose transferase-like glycosyltransferase
MTVDPVVATQGRSRDWRAPFVLAALVALAALAYGWHANGQALEIYYAAAVRSMSASWHDFLFGAFDPAGTVSLDKLPGAFWLQALSVRIFGLHAWAIVLPQIAEGAATVVGLFAVVRRHAGAPAGLLAAALLLLSPAAVALDRGNISDSLMIMLMVLAAGATVRAADGGSLRMLVLAAVLAGLAFQAKMLEAWLLLPALAVTYAIAAPGSMRRRIGALAAAGAVVVVVSLSWMTFVMLVPSHDRPYVDGSNNNSTYAQVFQYNGLSRVDSPVASTAASGAVAAPVLAAFTVRHGPGADRLLVGQAGRDIAWLLPAAVLAAIALLVSRRRFDRRDPVRAGTILWGLWLVTLLGAFSFGGRLNPYYLAALSPPIAALCAIGAREAWRLAAGRPGGRRALTLAAVASVLTTAYALALVPGRAPGWIAPVVAVAGVAALVVAALALAKGPGLAGVAIGAVVIAGVIAPAGAAIGLATDHRGPFDTPFESPAVSAVTVGLASAANHPSAASISLFERTAGIYPYPLATYTSLVAAPLIYATGQEVLPIGGFRGTNPSPTLARLQQLVRSNELPVILGPPAADARIRWAASYCPTLPAAGPLPILACNLRH